MFPFSVLCVQCKNCNPNKHLEKKDENSRPFYPLGIHDLNMTYIQSEIGEKKVGGNDIADTNVYSGNGNIQKEESASSWALIKENTYRKRGRSLYFIKFSF